MKKIKTLTLGIYAISVVFAASVLFVGCDKTNENKLFENFIEKNMQIVDGGTLPDFYIGKAEVTQLLWEAVMNSNPSSFQDENCPVENIYSTEIVGTDDYPEAYTINDVTYYQNGFCYKLSQLVGGGYQFRLPTEAEWEYAASGGNAATSWTVYSGSNNIGDVAWYSGNSGRRTHAVATKKANALGIYDMSGNVWEWCSEWGEDYVYAVSGHVIRGGGWETDAEECSVVPLSRYIAGKSYNFVGFRLAYSVE